MYSSKEGVSIITCTSKQGFIDNIFQNYKRQDYKNKELIIILNNDEMDVNQWINKARKYRDVKVYKCKESFSLGKCLNYAVEKSKYPYIAKFDDDDHYTSRYLKDSINIFKEHNADIVGKATFFVYFIKSKILALRKPGRENKWDLTFLHGGSIVFKKDIFRKVKFADVSIGEDDRLVQDCLKKGLKVYSTDRFNYAYIRYDGAHHTYKIIEDDYLRDCEIIAEIDDFTSLLTKRNNI